MELLEAVPGTLILKTLHPVRHLAIPEELLESVPGTDGSWIVYLEPSFSKPLIQIAILRFLWNLWRLYLVPMVHLRPGLPPVLPAQAGACQGGCQPVNQQDPGRDVKTQEHYNLLRGTRQAGESALIHRGKRAYPEHRTGVQPQENLPG